ncbi:MAG: M23 family metallopeptidase [Granulosicoccaceae bacterium]|jgi:murein DD-endopeptidase MepM/ murein hydrolase activator NlpD
MNIVFFTKQKGRVACLQMSRVRCALAGFVLLAVPAALVFGGYQFGKQSSVAGFDPVTEQMRAELASHREAVTQAKAEAERNITALSQQLGRMQARVIRLDALGRRLTEIAKLDKGEFDFDAEPAQGGPQMAEQLVTPEVPDFIQELDALSRQLDDRSEQLSVLETMLMNRNLQQQALPAGRPIKKGWISSYYGMRTDPFTGKREHHAGVDFAGKHGAEVVAVGAGVVTWASERYGYGNLVEITHGNGIATRYGHNHKILVKVGDKVEKGDTLALMGSTGRSTGPHVHFEVLKNGRSVNPSEYIQAAR